MKIVIDTNVIVSALLTPTGVSAEVVRLATNPPFSFLLDERLLSEYRGVLQRPHFQIDPVMADEMLAMLDRIALYIEAEPLPYAIPDPDDVPFLEVALSGEAECLITGNKKDFGKPNLGKPPKELKILTPAEFLEFYRKSLMD